MLYIISTPIGNIKDITIRAIEKLKEVDLILCEDTRETAKLLNYYGIKKPLLSYYKDNERRRVKKVISMLEEGKEIALVCDRGTPGISDPAYLLVRECHKRNIKVSSIPGPSALTSALSVSGLPSDKFTFYGFIPRKKGKKEKFLNEIKEKEETVVLFESVHRIFETLEMLNKTMPDREICVCRELTKKFEEIKTGTVKEIYEYFKEKEMKGEFVLIIKGRG